MTPAGNEPATFRFVAQHYKHLLRSQLFSFRRFFDKEHRLSHREGFSWKFIFGVISKIYRQNSEFVCNPAKKKQL